MHAKISDAKFKANRCDIDIITDKAARPESEQ